MSIGRLCEGTTGRVESELPAASRSRWQAISSVSAASRQWRPSMRTWRLWCRSCVRPAPAAAAAAAAPLRPIAAINAAAPAFDPWAGQRFGQPQQQHSSSNSSQQSRTACPGGAAGEAPLCGVGSRWRLYEEKWVLSGEGKYNASRPLTWRKDLVDYMAGRCSDMDR